MTIICSLSFLNAVVDLCMVVGEGEGSLVNDPLSVTFKPKRGPSLLDVKH